MPADVGLATGTAVAPPDCAGHLHHPALGDVAFEHTVLQVADQPEQMLVYFTTADIPQSALARLAAGIPGGPSMPRVRNSPA